MTCWPQRLLISSANRRARISVTLPAPNGTTIVTRWVGQFCAEAGALSMPIAAANAATPSQSFFICFIVCSSWVVLSFGHCSGHAGWLCVLFRHHFVKALAKVLEHDGGGISSRTA